MKTHNTLVNDRSQHISSYTTFAAVIMVAIAMAPGILYADVGTAICGIADNFTGNAGRGIATIGISVLGTLATLGRVTWTQALVIGVGVAVLFGATAVAQNLGMTGSCP